MNTTDRLDEIEARANAAQAAPWRAGHWEDFYGKEVTYSIETATTSRVADYLSDPDDAAFIAHAREDVPQLVAALRAVLEIADRASNSDRAIVADLGDDLLASVRRALGGA